MVPNKTTRSPKSASPAGPQAEAQKASRPDAARRPAAAKAPRAAKAAAGRAPGKSDTAAPVPGSRMVTRRPAPGSVQPKAVVSDENIRIRAYFLSLEYRGNNRNDVDFWLLAERELRPAKKSAD